MTDQELDSNRAAVFERLADAHRFNKITDAEWHAALCRELELSRLMTMIAQLAAVVAELGHKE